MSTKEFLTRRQVLLILGANALISVVISMVVGLLLRQPGPVASPAAPTATQEVIVAPTAPLAGPTAVIHVVQAGETISFLALQYDVPAEDIIAANQLTDPNVLQVGMRLIIPVGGLPEATATLPPPPPPTVTPTPMPIEPTPTAIVQVGSTATMAPTGVPTDTPVAGELDVEITDVLSEGNANQEAVVIVNRGQQLADMRGWTLSDENGNIYTFGELRLWPGGSVTVNTRVGQNGTPAFNFFWGKLQPVWTAAETATLKDAAGTEMATFTVP